MSNTAVNSNDMMKYHHAEGPRSRTSGALGLLIWISIAAVFAVAFAEYLAR